MSARAPTLGPVTLGPMLGPMLLGLALFAPACGSPSTTPHKIDARAKPARPPPPPIRKTPAELAALSHEIVIGPAATGSRDDRQAAVLALLTDGTSAEHLPLDVAALGDSFDFTLVEAGGAVTRVARMHHGRPSVTGYGQLTPAQLSQLRQIIAAHNPDLHGCHAAAVASNPALVGSLHLRFEIAVDGTLDATPTAESTLEDPELERCMIAALGDAKLPAPSGGPVTVDYPFEFVAP